MSYQDKNLSASAKALILAGKHIRTKDGSDDPFDLLTKKFGDLTDETIKRIGTTDEKLNETQAMLADLDQKMARGFSHGGVAKPDTWGEEFIKAKATELEALAAGNAGQNARVSMNVKAVTTAEAGALDVPTRDAMNMLPRQRLTIRNLLNVISISSGSVEYASQTVRPEGADTVAETAAKPESQMEWELRNTSAKVIAHWVKASRQILEDAPQLSNFIDSEMRYGLALKEESQLLSGDGTGANLAGMIPASTAYDDTVLTVANQNEIDMVGKAILQCALADYPATGIVIHPADWWRMRMLKDADGKYILGDPQQVVQPSLFGLPVVATKSMAIDTFLVADFQSAGTLYDRWQPRVETGYVDQDFTNNMVTVLAEERIAFAVKNALALTYGDFGNVA